MIMRPLTKMLGVLAGAAVLSACITDYAGWPEHNTQAEAKFWGQEIAVSSGDPTTDGTFAPTVKYDCRGVGQDCTYYLTTYRNAVFGAFSRDGIVDRDGDDIQGSQGSLTSAPATPAGQFFKAYTWLDTDFTACQFFDNLRQNFLKFPPAVAVCFTAPTEEVDKDLDIQEQFGSLGDLFGQIWSGALGSSFTLELTAVELDGVSIPLANALTIDMAHNGIRPHSFAIDLTTPGGQDLIRAILDNTQHRVPVTLGATFNGGMHFSMPVMMSFAFDHDRLSAGL
jgi:hypothetical protein